MTKVFVSGASGYIAQHIVQELVKNGYKVVGSVRSKEKGEFLRKQFQPSNFDYEIVQDITKKGSFDDALKKHPEVTVFLHTASPFHYQAKDVEKELLMPAVEGTRNALKAIKEQAPQVKQVVITSSYAAIKDDSKEKDGSHSFTEKDWDPITREEAVKDPFSGYKGSKTFAEQAAWQFMETEKPLFVLSAVNPVFVFGPQASVAGVKDTLNTSSEMINLLLKLKPQDPIPQQVGFFIDVRDVAKAHLAAFEKDEAKNQRLLLSNGRFTPQLILDLIHQNFPEISNSLPKGDTGKYPDFSQYAKIDNSLTRKILGFDFFTLEDSVKDSVKQILDVKKNLK